MGQDAERIVPFFTIATRNVAPRALIRLLIAPTRPYAPPLAPTRSYTGFEREPRGAVH